jgi:hypothetical protein
MPVRRGSSLPSTDVNRTAETENANMNERADLPSWFVDPLILQVAPRATCSMRPMHQG